MNDIEFIALAGFQGQRFKPGRRPVVDREVKKVERQTYPAHMLQTVHNVVL